MKSDQVNSSSRLPLLVLFLSAAIWLAIGSVLGLIASIKFHSPAFLADISWLTYGRVRAACSDSFLYGFCLQAGLGLCLWLFAHLGRAPLAGRSLVTLGAALWNLGVTIGVGGVLAGDSTGFETLELPRYSVVLVFLGYLMIGFWAVVNFHQRRERSLFVSQWFLFVALFWFPWIYTTAELLLVARPVRGVAQAVLAWWYADNLLIVWFGLVGLAAVFYLVPKLLNRELHSHYLALLTFWMLILFGSWEGIPGTAPLPAWMPALSGAATILMLIVLLGVALNVYATTQQPQPETPYLPGLTPRPSTAARHHSALKFILFGVTAFVLAGLMRLASVLVEGFSLLNFTWFDTAQSDLQSYGFFAMVMFGAIYALLPQLTGSEFPRPALVRAHFWVAAIGIGLTFVPLALGGVVQGFKLADPSIPFLDISKATLSFLRVSTLGDLLLLIGSLLFLLNLAGLFGQFYRTRAAAAYAVITEDLFNPGAAKP